MTNINNRIKRIANAIDERGGENLPRFTMYRSPTTIHIKLDGWDVATYDSKSETSGYNSAQVLLSEQLLDIPATVE